MVEFALPKNSRISGGKVWPKPASATEPREFKLYRENTDAGMVNLSASAVHAETLICNPLSP